MTAPARKRRLGRRGFLALAGVSGGAVGLWVLLGAGRRYMLDNLESFGPSVPDDPNGWLHVGADNRVELRMPKAEMGQGVHTAFQQIVAEELYVAVDQVTVSLADTTVLPADSRGTNGSNSVASLYPVLRRAAAQAREMLRAEAAAELGEPLETLTVRQGEILAGGRATGRTYGTLLAGKQIVAVADTDPPLKPVEAFEIIGQAVPRLDLPAKVDGSAVYAYDARLEGMAYGKVLKPPSIGAKLVSVDASGAQAVPGVLAVVVEEGFVGVVAETQEAALRGVGRLQAQWEERQPALQQADIDAAMQADGGEVLQSAGSPARARASAAQQFEAVYTTPFAAHATLEPQAGLAHVRQVEGVWRADVWTATQNPTGLVGDLAEAVGLEAGQVVVHPLYLGGAFGRKVVSNAALEAARLSKATGRPVRVNWDRREEFQHGFVRPPTRSVLRAGLTAAGRVAGWEHAQASGLVLFAFFPGFLRTLFGSDFGATRGAVAPYAFSDHRTTARLVDLPVMTSSWRGLGLLPNVFAVESFVDELAHAAGADPLAFRLAHLGADPVSQRLARALTAAAGAAGWSQPLPAAEPGWAVGRGLACCEDVGTVVAQVAEVAVNSATGAVRVLRVVCAIDCGLVINPDGVRAQVEGNVMWGAGSALFEALSVVDGRLSADNFGDYPLLTIRQAPDVEVVLIDNPGEGPYGVGEPPIGPVAAAIANGVFAATGARLRALPLTPERVLAALV